MDKQARLSAIMMAINEFKQKEEQAAFGADLALKVREYEHLNVCARKLLAAENELNILAAEAKSLQEAIEDESKETIL